ncbi:Thioredoxin-dependent peroxide reductase [Micractinium conductrix]|nr:Thioredoxin-dependent peroxide reductase [Micractinium conductrix]|eukprot:PSC67995.1 Thioredoxin-dependent peroxide reductase [Micractinium conductrix]
MDDLIASGKKVVVKFWAPWCNKCRMIAPKVDGMQAQNPDVSFVSFDTTEAALENLTAELGVKALPQFRFYANGKEVLEPIKGYKLQTLADAISKLNGM